MEVSTTLVYGQSFLFKIKYKHPSNQRKFITHQAWFTLDGFLRLRGTGMVTRSDTVAIRKEILKALQMAWAKGYRAVFPFQVQAFMDVSRDESSIRRQMAQMAHSGEIVRLGPRKGYALQNFSIGIA